MTISDFSRNPLDWHQARNMTNEQRFWYYVDRPNNWQGEGAFHCWNWKGATVQGYGMFTLSGSKRKVTAHRFSFELFNGKISHKLFVCHKCDNPQCVNPNHLFLGTCHDNLVDMMEKHRRLYRLSHNDVLHIKQLRNQGITQIELSKKFHVSIHTIQAIDQNKTWRWVK